MIAQEACLEGLGEKQEASATWERLDDLDEIEVRMMGEAIVVIGMDNCDACDVVASQAAEFVRNNAEGSLRLYKFSTRDKSAEQLSLLGKELRFFPTVLGFLEGRLAFRFQGALVDDHPTDCSRMMRGFGRARERLEALQNQPARIENNEMC